MQSVSVWALKLVGYDEELQSCGNPDPDPDLEEEEKSWISDGGRLENNVGDKHIFEFDKKWEKKQKCIFIFFNFISFLTVQMGVIMNNQKTKVCWGGFYCCSYHK